MSPWGKQDTNRPRKVLKATPWGLSRHPIKRRRTPLKIAKGAPPPLAARRYLRPLISQAHSNQILKNKKNVGVRHLPYISRYGSWESIEGISSFEASKNLK